MVIRLPDDYAPPLQERGAYYQRKVAYRNERILTLPGNEVFRPVGEAHICTDPIQGHTI